MGKYFNTEGCCRQEEHYMTEFSSHLSKIKYMIYEGKYISLDLCGRYGRTTFLRSLKNNLAEDYTAFSINFQKINEFESEGSFVKALARELLSENRKDIPEDILNTLDVVQMSEDYSFSDICMIIGEWCSVAEKPCAMIIDGSAKVSDNQMFLEFLAQLSMLSADMEEIPAVQSLIFAGLNDISDLGQKVCPDAAQRQGSSWDNAENYKIDLELSVSDINSMLKDYETDCRTGMKTEKTAKIIYSYTSGDPLLVSSVCKINAEVLSEEIRWTEKGISAAAGEIVSAEKPVFESLINILDNDEKLCSDVRSMLISGEKINYDSELPSLDAAARCGFMKNDSGMIKITNRIYETGLYEYFLNAEKCRESEIYKAGESDRTQFTENGVLDIEKVIEKYISHFNEICGSQSEQFRAEKCREYFLMYMKPVINRSGNYFIESQTRDTSRTDVVIDYSGERYIIEINAWCSEKYNHESEEKFAGYLSTTNVDKGYLLSFCFSRNKIPGVYKARIYGKRVIETVI